MAVSKETLAEELTKELTKLMGNSSDQFQAPDKAVQVRAPSTLRVCIRYGVRWNFGD
jgi:hypothetical protein